MYDSGQARCQPGCQTNQILNSLALKHNPGAWGRQKSLETERTSLSLWFGEQLGTDDSG